MNEDTAPDNPSVTEQPPTWKSVSEDPRFQTQSPDERLVTYSKWHDDTYNYARAQPDWEQVAPSFNQKAADVQKDLGEQARAFINNESPTVAHYKRLAGLELDPLTPDEARYNIAQRKQTSGQPLNPDEQSALSKGTPDTSFLRKTALGSLISAAGRQILPTAAGLKGAVTGAGIGATVPVLGETGISEFLGGLIGFGLASWGAKKLQDSAVNNIDPHSAFGSQVEAEQAANHPWASELGGLLAFGKPNPAKLFNSIPAMTELARGAITLTRNDTIKALVDFSKLGADKFAQEYADRPQLQRDVYNIFHIASAGGGNALFNAYDQVRSGQFSPTDLMKSAAEGALFNEPWIDAVSPHTRVMESTRQKLHDQNQNLANQVEKNATPEDKARATLLQRQAELARKSGIPQTANELERQASETLQPAVQQVANAQPIPLVEKATAQAGEHFVEDGKLFRMNEQGQPEEVTPPEQPAKAPVAKASEQVEKERVDNDAQTFKDRILTEAKQQALSEGTPTAARAGRVETIISQERRVAEANKDPVLREGYRLAHEEASKNVDQLPGADQARATHFNQTATEQPPKLYERTPPRTAAEVGITPREGEKVEGPVLLTPEAARKLATSPNGRIPAGGATMAEGIVGQTHSDLIGPAIANGGEYIGQPQHAFRVGNEILDRNEAGKVADANEQREPERAGTPLQSQHLREPVEVGAAKREVKEKDLWGKAGQYLTDEQKAGVSDRFVSRVTDLFDNFKPHKTIKDAAEGKFLKGWYEKFGKWMLDLMGPDTPRFARLFAAFGANNSPLENTLRALDTWNTWVERGRPNDEASINKLLEDTVITETGRAKGRTAKDIMAWGNNVKRVLMTDDPTKVKLSGPKVDPYSANFLGDMDRTTLDRHMGIPYALQQGLSLTEAMAKGSQIFGRRTTRTPEGDVLGGQGFPGMAYEAHLRHAAEIISERIGEPWQAAHIQEAIWGKYQPLKMLSEEMGVPLDDLLSGKVKYSKERLTQLREKIQPEAILNNPKIQAEITRLERASQQGGSEREPIAATATREEPGTRGLPESESTGRLRAGVGAEPRPVGGIEKSENGFTGRLPAVDVGAGARESLTPQTEEAQDQLVQKVFQSLPEDIRNGVKIESSDKGGGSPMFVQFSKNGDAPMTKELYYNPRGLEYALSLSEKAGFTREEALRDMLARHELIHWNDSVSYNQAVEDGRSILQNKELAHRIADNYIDARVTGAAREERIAKMLDEKDESKLVALGYEAVEQLSRNDGTLSEDMYRQMPKSILERVAAFITRQLRILQGKKDYTQLSDAMKARVDKAREFRGKLEASLGKPETHIALTEDERALMNADEGMTVGTAPRAPPLPPLLNVGLDTADGKGIAPADVLDELKKFGVEQTEPYTVHSRAEKREPTMVVKLNRELTSDEAHQLSANLKQEAIAQYANGKGELYGPGAEKWRPFNPNFFMMPKNETLSGKQGAQPRLDETLARFIQELSPEGKKVIALKSPLQFKGEPLPNSVQGEIPVVHYSDKTLDTVEPNKSREKGAQGDFFVAGTTMAGDEKLFGKGDKHAYGAKIDGSQIYDLSKGKPDPLNWNTTINRDDANEAVRAAGYKGILVETDDGRKVLRMLEPTKVESIGKPEPGSRAAMVGAAPREEQKMQARWENGKLVVEPQPAAPEGGGMAVRVREQRMPGQIETGTPRDQEQLRAIGEGRLAKGENPDQVLNGLLQRGEAAKPEDIALFQAQTRQLSAATDAAKAAGNNEAAEKAYVQEKAWRDKLAPFQQAWHESGVAMQESENFGNEFGMQRAFEARYKQEMTDAQKQAAVKPVKAVKAADADLDKATAAMDKAVGTKPSAVPTDAKGLADYFNQRKGTGGIFVGAAPREEKLTFTPQEVQSIWKFSRPIIEQLKTFGDVSRAAEHVSNALNGALTADEIRAAWAQPKRIVNEKPADVAKELFEAMSKRRAAVDQARSFLDRAQMSGFDKVIRDIVDFPRTLAILGHANPLITHAGRNLFTPETWSNWGSSFVKQFKFLANPAAHEIAMQRILEDPLYMEAKKAGLRVSPYELEDYSRYNKVLGSALGSRLAAVGRAGNRAMDALKVFRMEMYKQYVEDLAGGLQGQDRTDAAKAVATVVNHISGYSNNAATRFFKDIGFAPGLEGSRWAFIGDYKNALRTTAKLATGQAVTAGERAQAKLSARRAAQFVGMMAGAMLANQALIKATGQDDDINWKDPTQTDFLRFKWDGKTLDPSGGLFQPVRLLARLAAISTMEKGEKQGAFLKEIANYAAGKANPGITAGIEMATGQDAMGRALPFREPTTSKEPYTVSEYALSKSPIPVSEMSKVIHDEIAKETSPSIAKEIMTGLAGLGIGVLGVKQGTTPQNPWEPRP